MLYYNRISPKIKRDIFRIIPFGIIWFIFALVYLILEKGLMGNLELYPSTGNEYEFGLTSFVNLFGATFAGLVIGFFEIKFMEKRFIDKSFAKKILYKTIIYILIMIVFLIMISLARYSVQLKTHIFDIRVWENLLSFFSHFIFWSMELYIAAIISTTLFFSEVSQNLGTKGSRR